MRVITREFWCTPIDFVAIGFSLYARRRWPYWAAMLVGGKALQLTGAGGALVGFTVIVAAMFLPALLWLRLSALARRPENATFYLPRTMEIDDFGFYVQPRTAAPTSVAWSSVESVAKVHQGHLIRTADRRSFYVPDYAFADGADRVRFARYVARSPIGSKADERLAEEEAATR